MDLKSLNKDRILRQILPSTFFIVFSALAIFQSSILIGKVLGAIVILLLLGNIFLKSFMGRFIGIMLGIIFLLCSCYFLMALFSDIVKEKATLAGGYWVGLVLVLSCMVMSVLLIWGYENKKPICETKQC